MESGEAREEKKKKMVPNNSNPASLGSEAQNQTQAGSNQYQLLCGQVHRVLFFLLTSFSTLLQGVKVNPFEKQNVKMLTFLVVLVTYFISLMAESRLHDQNSRLSRIVGRMSLLSGCLATALLVQVLIPVLGWIILATWVLWFVKEAFEMARTIMDRGL